MRLVIKLFAKISILLFILSTIPFALFWSFSSEIYLSVFFVLFSLVILISLLGALLLVIQIIIELFS